MKITDNLHSLTIPFTIKAGEMELDRFVQIYIIPCEKLYLIDSGVAASPELLFPYLREIGRRPSEIDTVFMTHAHPDHIGALQSIKKESGCRIIAHERARPWIEDTDLQFSERPVPGFHGLVEGSCDVDETLADGDIVSLGEGLTLKVMHTPGHSGGSLSFFFEEDRILVSGDVVTLPGDLPIYDDYEDLKRSLKRLHALDIEILLSSWADKAEGDTVKPKIDMSLAYLDKIDDVVRECAGGERPGDMTALCEGVVGKMGFPPVALNPLVARALMSHL